MSEVAHYNTSNESCVSMAPIGWVRSYNLTDKVEYSCDDVAGYFVGILSVRIWPTHRKMQWFVQLSIIILLIRIKVHLLTLTDNSSWPISAVAESFYLNFFLSREWRDNCLKNRALKCLGDKHSRLSVSVVRTYVEWVKSHKPTTATRLWKIFRQFFALTHFIVTRYEFARLDS